MVRWKQLPIAAVVFGLAGVLAIYAAFRLNYEQRETYIVSRNLRLLGVLARQTERAIDAAANKFAADKEVRNRLVNRQLGPHNGRPTLTFKGTSQPQAKEGAPQPPAKEHVLSTPVGEVLGHVYEPKLRQAAFDTIALVAPDGTVALAVGRREWEITSVDLGALLRLPQPAAGTPPGGSSSPVSAGPRLLDSITVIETDLAGVSYRVFVQPCCRGLEQEPTQKSGVEQQPTQKGGAVIVGLAAVEAVNREAMAISPALVLIGLLLVALAFLAWPFLNVALQGPRKRLTLWDALPLGFSGVVGLSIATLLAITTVQCAALERDGEEQLRELAIQIDRDLKEEIRGNAATLDNFVSWLQACPQSVGTTSVVVEAGCAASDPAASKVDPSSRDYVFAALINEKGMQVRKAMPSLKPPHQPPPLVDVQDRTYFQQAMKLASRTEPVKPPPPGAPSSCLAAPCVLESLVSYTSGSVSAVLARPSGNQALPVAALTVPMRAVIDPALPPGFEFAVIEKTGRVVFHSDVQRNTFEDLILETDRNPTLRSLIATGLNGTVRMDYWGRPYLAHVRHTEAFGWAIVTLLERQHLRGLTLEWSMVSVFLVGAYAVLWTVTLCGVIASKPAWLWPDRFRRWRYRQLSVFCLVILAGFGVAAASGLLTRTMMGAAGFLLPLVACVVALLVLKRRPAAIVGTPRLDLRWDYCVPGAVFLIVMGVLPGAAFVMRAYDANVEAYLKHRQIGIVQALAERQPLAEVLTSCDHDPPPDSTTHAWHSEFFYGTKLCLADGPVPGGEPGGSGQGGDSDPWWLPEANVPYFSETSVQIRELVHRHADDGSWMSQRKGPELTLHVPHNGAGPNRHVMATTTVPALAIGNLVGMLLAATAVLAVLAYGIAWFIAHHLFLGHISPPSWALGRLAIPEGTTVVLACDQAAVAPRIHGARTLALMEGPEPVTVEAGLARARARLAEVDARDPVVITDLIPPGAAANLRIASALAGQRTHALLLLSTHTLPELVEAFGAPGQVSPELDGLEIAIGELSDDVIDLDWRTHAGAATGPLMLSTVQSLRGRWRRFVARLGRPAHEATPKPPTVVKAYAGEAVVRAEERAHPGLRPIGASIRRLDAFRGRRLTRDEVLEEFAESAEDFYLELWNACSDEEKLELLHIAQLGVAHPGNARAVRRLIGNRLVTKDPELRLMNRTFTHFVLSSRREGSSAQADVARIEGALEESPWDRFRLPFALGVIGVAAFLFVTQRDTYNVTVGAALSLATQLPNVLKALTLVAQKDPVATASRNT